MGAAIALIVAILPEIPSLIGAVTQLIERGRKTGELSSAEADALTVMANSVFAKYSKPAPPPPGAGDGS